MPDYSYTVKDGSGALIEGKLKADSIRSAVEKLSSMGYYPLNIEDADSKGVGSAKGKVKSNEIVVYTRQLADLLGSGLTLSNALEVLSKQTRNGYFKWVISEINEKIKAGKSLSESFNEFPHVFSTLYVGLIKSGEAGGTLKEVLDNLSEYLEKEQEIKSKVISAMAYPLLVLIAGFGTLVFLFTFVIPKLVKIFNEMNQTLPLPTKIIIAVSHFLVNYWLLIMGCIMLFVVVAVRSRRNMKIKRKLDIFKLRIPFWGDVIKKVEIARISRTLAMCIRNGVSLLAALKVVESVAGNEAFKEEVRSIGEGIKEGKSFYLCIKESIYFPAVFSSMIAVGEESNTLDKVLLKIESNYLRDLDTATKITTALIEPLAILVLGMIIALVVMAVLLPIFKMNFGVS